MEKKYPMGKFSILDLIKKYNLKDKKIAVECNGTIISKNQL